MDDKWMISNMKTCAGMYIKNGENLQKDFHQLYKAVPDIRKRNNRQKAKKKHDSKQKKEKYKNDLVSGESRSTDAMPVVELLSNPSSFAVYSQIRGLVLENIIGKCQRIYLSSTQINPLDTDSDDESDALKDSVCEIPKVKLSRGTW